MNFARGRQHQRRAAKRGRGLRQVGFASAVRNCERLEDRWLLTAGPDDLSTPYPMESYLDALPQAFSLAEADMLNDGDVVPLAGSASPTGYSPAQVRNAYGYDQIFFEGGTIVGDGTGQTIAIGGIETGMNSESEARVPLLSRIPILGALFRSKAKEAQMTELVIFITPYILERQEDVEGTGQINPDQ